MKEQKDIFDLFKENQHKLEERPPRRTWQRLERRLDVQKKTNGFPVYRQLAMVAAMLVFVLVCAVLLLLPKHGEPQLVLNEVEAVPLEDLVFSDVDEKAMQVVEFTRHLKNRKSNPIAEGNRAKKLFVSYSGTFNAYQQEAVGDKNGGKSINVSPRPAVQRMFNWLIGDWKSEKDGKVSKERWVVRDSQTLQGKGVLVKGKDTLFAEDMSISNFGEKVFLNTALDISEKQVQYELVALDSNRAVFENQKVNFPQQVIFKQNSAKNFSTIYQNARPLNMPKSQMDYMQNRNALFNEQAVRNLSKVSKKSGR